MGHEGENEGVKLTLNFQASFAFIDPARDLDLCTPSDFIEF